MTTYRSPAKINLFLRILSRRPDGYHELASLFQAISLYDNLTVELSPSSEDSFSCSNPALPTDSSNLVLKALSLYRRKTGILTPVRIHLDKHIPAEAGLGGGSSNAATMLWALNQLCGGAATLDELKSWSAEIGSDITFFLSQGTAYCTGRGEVITDLPFLPPKSLWIVKPPFGLSTPRVYQALNIETLSTSTPSRLLENFQNDRPEYVNDLETPAFDLLPELKALKTDLQKSYEVVLMSGSGTSFFCVGEKRPSLSETYFVAPVNFSRRQDKNWY